MNIGKAFPIIPTDKLVDVNNDIRRKWKFGYIKSIGDNEVLTYPYQAYYTSGDDVWKHYPLKREEFEYAKPFNKADWL